MFPILKISLVSGNLISFEGNWKSGWAVVVKGVFLHFNPSYTNPISPLSIAALRSVFQLSDVQARTYILSDGHASRLAYGFACKVRKTKIGVDYHIFTQVTFITFTSSQVFRSI